MLLGYCRYYILSDFHVPENTLYPQYNHRRALHHIFLVWTFSGTAHDKSWTMNDLLTYAFYDIMQITLEKG